MYRKGAIKPKDSMIGGPLLLVTLFSLLFACSYWLMNYSERVVIAQNEFAPPSGQNEFAPPSGQNELGSFSLYENPQYGIKIEYPTSWIQLGEQELSYPIIAEFSSQKGADFRVLH